MKTAAEASTMKVWLVLSLSAVTSSFHLAQQGKPSFLDSCRRRLVSSFKRVLMPTWTLSRRVSLQVVDGSGRCVCTICQKNRAAERNVGKITADVFLLCTCTNRECVSSCVQHNKFYNMKEYYQRLQIFTQHKKRIDKHNEGNHSFTSKNTLLPFWPSLWLLWNDSCLSAVALNQFSDMTFSEFQQSFLWSVPQVTSRGATWNLSWELFFKQVMHIICIYLLCRTALPQREPTVAVMDHIQTP